MTQRLWSFNDENAFCFSHCFHLPSASFLVEVIFVALVDSWKLVDFGVPLGTVQRNPPLTHSIDRCLVTTPGCTQDVIPAMMSHHTLWFLRSSPYHLTSMHFTSSEARKNAQTNKQTNKQPNKQTNDSNDSKSFR